MLQAITGKFTLQEMENNPSRLLALTGVNLFQLLPTVTQIQIPLREWYLDVIISKYFPKHEVEITPDN